MPVYEYQCTGCGQIEEAFQKISDPPKETCAHCRGPLKKLISQSSFHLKGTGWYVTDYGGNKTPGGASGGAAEETKSDTKSDTTPKKKEATAKNTGDGKKSS